MSQSTRSRVDYQRQVFLVLLLWEILLLLFFFLSFFLFLLFFFLSFFLFLLFFLLLLLPLPLLLPLLLPLPPLLPPPLLLPLPPLLPPPLPPLPLLLPDLLPVLLLLSGLVQLKRSVCLLGKLFMNQRRCEFPVWLFGSELEINFIKVQQTFSQDMKICLSLNRKRYTGGNMTGSKGTEQEGSGNMNNRGEEEEQRNKRGRGFEQTLQGSESQWTQLYHPPTHTHTHTHTHSSTNS